MLIKLYFKVRNIQASGNQGAVTRRDQSAYRVPGIPLPTHSLIGPLPINTNSLVSGGARLHELDPVSRITGIPST